MNCGRLALLCLLLVVLLPPAYPQASTATVSGTVRDQTGAVIPAAAVTLKNTATNVVSKTTTNSVGFYFLPGVVPGPYDLTVEAAGMQKFEGTLTVLVQQSAVVDAVLRVGQAATEVSVQDVTPLVAADSPTMGHTLERQRIEQLPINGRFITELLGTAYGPKTQFLPFSANSGIARRLRMKPHTLEVGLGQTLSGVEAESRSSSQLGRSFRIAPRKLGVLGFCACVAISRHWAANSYSATFISIRREFYNSGSGAVVVVQRDAQALAALDLTCVAEMASLWADELVRQALMIALAVIQVSNRTPILGNCETSIIPGIPGATAR